MWYTRRFVHDVSACFLEGTNCVTTFFFIGTKRKYNAEMQCVLCNETDANVATVATCSNRCTVMAHAVCFQKRQTFPQWRKKHHDRDNAEAEVCLLVGCQGKCKVKAAVRNERVRETHKFKDTSTTDVPLDDPSHPCCFTGRDGLPCRRPAVANNACTRHAREAEIMCMMVKKQETAAVVSAPVESTEIPEETKRVKNAVAQTTVDEVTRNHASTQTIVEMETNEDLRKEIEEMEYAAHREALRITRLEIKMENDREELDTERALLQSAAEEDRRTIASLKEEVKCLRAENVTLKRREESIKARYMSSRDTQRKEIVRTIQEFLASM